VAGTALGVGASTFLEVFYIQFSKDGKVDIFEHEVLKKLVFILRFGLLLLVLSGFGLMVLWRLRVMGPDVFFSARYLTKMSVVLILLFTAFLMNFRLINLRIGSAISITSWYWAMILGIWRNAKISLVLLMTLYVVSIALVYLLLEFVRSKTIKSK